MAGLETVTPVIVSCERVRACTGLATEENHRKWFSSQALSAGVGRSVPSSQGAVIDVKEGIKSIEAMGSAYSNGREACFPMCTTFFIA